MERSAIRGSHGLAVMQPRLVDEPVLRPACRRKSAPIAATADLDPILSLPAIVHHQPIAVAALAHLIVGDLEVRQAQRLVGA
jgi:hypothetical protein